jgi:hypothetical protein
MTPNFELLHKYINDIQVNISENDVLELLKMKRRWHYRTPHRRAYSSLNGSVQIIDENGKTRTENMYDLEGYLIFKNTKEFYDRGFTLIITDVMDCFPEFRSIVKKSFELVGIEPKGNFYFSSAKNKKASLDEHKDAYPIITKNIYGETLWTIDKNNVLLDKQNAIFLHTNVPHAVLENKSKRLSCTISFY